METRIPNQSDIQCENQTKSSFGFGKAVLIVIATGVLQIIGSSLIKNLGNNHVIENEMSIRDLTIGIGLPISLLFSIVVISAFYSVDRSVLQWENRYLKLIFFGFCFVLGINYLLTLLLSSFIETESMIDQFNQSKLWALLLGPALIGPICEEIIYRGIILEQFLKNQYTDHTAILLTSFLFGFAHLNLLQFFSAFVIGLIFGWLYTRTKSLWICIVVHILNNSVAIIVFKNTDIEFIDKFYKEEQSIVFLVSAIALAWFGYYYFRRLLNK